jgi:hypothetical protein
MADASPEQVKLTTQELGTALHVAGVFPQVHSPLKLVRPNGNANPAPLRTRGILDGQGNMAHKWRLALAALSAPQEIVWTFSRTSLDPGTATLFVPAGLGFVGHAQSGDVHSLVMPFLPDTLVDTLLSTLAPDNLGEVRAFTESLWPDELTAVVAVSDVCREEGLRAMLDRRTPHFGTALLNKLEYELRWAASNDDPRWMGGVLRAHAPEYFMPRAEHLRSGVQGLVNRGWLSFSNDRLVLSSDMQGLCFVLSNTIPHLHVHTRPADGTTRVALLIRSLVAIMTLEFLVTDRGEPFVRMSAVDATRARQLLSACVLPVSISLTRPQPSAIPSGTHSEPTMWASRTADQRTATNRPASPSLKPLTCPSCGKSASVGQKFCRSCGHSIG